MLDKELYLKNNIKLNTFLDKINIKYKNDMEKLNIPKKGCNR